MKIILLFAVLTLAGCGEWPMEQRNREAFRDPDFNEQADCDEYARDWRSTRYDPRCKP